MMAEEPERGEVLVDPVWITVPGQHGVAPAFVATTLACPGDEFPVGSQLLHVGSGSDRREATPLVVAAARCVPVPRPEVAVLALLAAPLAQVHRYLDAINRPPEELVLTPYGLLCALAHVSARTRWPGVTFRVEAPAPDYSDLARALGARAGSDARITSGAVVFDVNAVDLSPPEPPELARALAEIALHPWAYRPLVGAALLAGEAARDLEGVAGLHVAYR